jgi:hypothetical protein
MQGRAMNVDNRCQAESGGGLTFRDLTAEIVRNMTPEETEDLAAACWAGFIYGGDPRCWEGFDGISTEAQFILSYEYQNWLESNPPDLGFGEHTLLN